MSRDLVIHRFPEKLTPYQLSILDHPARFLFIGTSVKTGKTFILVQWILEELAKGNQCAWVSAYYKRARTAFDYLCDALQEAEKAKLVKINRSELQIRLPNGGLLDFYSADNPQAIFGASYHSVACDELSRWPEASWNAIRSTVSATNGRMKLATNLDASRSHWSNREFLLAKSGSEPTYSAIHITAYESPFITEDEILAAKRTLPDGVFRALYLAEIMEDGASVFRNFKACHSGTLMNPEAGRTYIGGVDLARSVDYTVITLIDAETGHVVYWDRFHGVSWQIQCERIKDVAKRYNNAVLYVDSTGLGDVISEQLQTMDLNVHPYVFSNASKRDLIERLILSIEHRLISWPANLDILNGELEVFEYSVKPGSNAISYNAPDGFHDDATISLALANYSLSDIKRSVTKPNQIHMTHTQFGSDAPTF